MPRRRHSHRRNDREIEISAELEDALQRHRESFVEKFGREPSGDDPLFFDPDSDVVEPLDISDFEKELTEAMGGAITEYEELTGGKPS